MVPVILFHAGFSWFRGGFVGVDVFFVLSGYLIIILSASPATVAGSWLSSPILVAVGAVSYSAYLWHQPLFAFARLRSVDGVTPSTLVALIGVTFALAYLSWRYVEQPFRDRKRFTTRQIFGTALAATVLLLAVGSVGILDRRFESRWRLPAPLETSFRQTDRLAQCFDQHSADTADNWSCDVAANGAPYSFAVFGDSHSVSLLPAFEKAATDLHINGLFVGSAACIPLLEVYVLQINPNGTNCHDLNLRVFDYVKTHAIRSLFLVARWVHYTDGGYEGRNFAYIGPSPDSAARKDTSRNAFRTGLDQTLKAYADVGTTVYLVQQVPEQALAPERLYYRSYREGDIAKAMALSVPRSRHVQLQQYVRTLFAESARQRRAVLIDFDPYFCGAERCVVGTTTQSFYTDTNHLSTAGAEFIRPELERYLSRMSRSELADEDRR